MDSTKQRQKVYEAIWKMDTFLEKFEAYHNCRAFNGLDKKTYDENIKNYPNHEHIKNRQITYMGDSDNYAYSPFIEDEHLEKFNQYLTFLNKIPEKHHKVEIEYLFGVFSKYSQYFKEYDHTYAATFDEHDNRTTKNMSNKRMAHIKIAKDFRDSLHGKQLSINNYNKDEIDYDIYLKDYKFLKELEELSSLDTFSILVGALTAYIEDIETKSYKIRSKQDYQNFLEKPSLDNLINHIKILAKKYNIKNTSLSIQNFQKYLNSTNYD